MRFNTICITFTLESHTGTRHSCLIDIANSTSFTTVVNCDDYKCSDGYEYKNDYDRITCKNDCDDDQCCNKGEWALPKWCIIPAYALY